MQNANNAQIAKHVTQDDTGFVLNIAVNAMWGDVQVQSITMYVSNEADEDEEYCDGDLAVNWDASKLQNNGGGNMGTLLMRGWNDAVGAVMRRFYSEGEFDSAVHDALCAAGFSSNAAGIYGSEWGMQEEGRASYDAYSIADEVRAAMLVQA